MQCLWLFWSWRISRGEHPLQEGKSHVVGPSRVQSNICTDLISSKEIPPSSTQQLLKPFSLSFLHIRTGENSLIPLDKGNKRALGATEPVSQEQFWFLHWGWLVYGGLVQPLALQAGTAPRTAPSPCSQPRLANPRQLLVDTGGSVSRGQCHDAGCFMSKSNFFFFSSNDLMNKNAIVKILPSFAPAL